MILLDTDHLTILRYFNHPQCASLNARLVGSSDKVVAISIVSVEEQTRGWLAKIARQKPPFDQVYPYEEFQRLFAFYKTWLIVPFDNRAAEVFFRLKKLKVRIGTQDLKIAAIALVNDALLLSANLRDFSKVPNLRVENWLK